MTQIGKFNPLLWLAVVLTALTLVNCSQKADLQKQMSGKWEERLTHEAVVLKIDGTSKTVSVDGKTYPATIEDMDQEKGELRLKVQNGGTEPEVWVMTQLWEDSDRFNIVLEKPDRKLVLIPRRG